jgi:hypothetical protein
MQPAPALELLPHVAVNPGLCNVLCTPREPILSDCWHCPCVAVIGSLSLCADALVEMIVGAGAVDAVVPLLSIAEKADPAVATR